MIINKTFYAKKKSQLKRILATGVFVAYEA